MIKRFGWAALAAMASTAFAQTVTVTLSSPQDGQTVAAGGNVSWSIAFTVSTLDNQGLALLSADLVQDAGNPALIDIPPAGSVPAAMSNFSRPAGISNPGETNPVTGYTGVQRGPAGARDLLQIGGGQNTFGVAQPGGTGIAENANVVGGVGQAGSVTLASGSFAAPSTNGSYTYSLANVIANTIQTRNNPPNFSPVLEASVVISDGAITFTVGGVECEGDVNGDNVVDLSDLATLLANFGRNPATREQGDLDGDLDVDLSDLATLLANFGSNC